MMLLIFGILLGIFICMLVPPKELLRKAIFFCLKTSEYLRQKAAAMAEEEKQDK